MLRVSENRNRKRYEKVRSDKIRAADRLVLKLFAPGISRHPPGWPGWLGVYAQIYRARIREGWFFGDDDVPGGPWEDGQPPWEIQADQLTLRFRAGGEASNFFQRLFKIAFSIDRGDQIIKLPGQYRLMPNTAILADLQLGLTLTFLQHGKTRTLAKDFATADHDPEGDGNPRVVVEYRKCSAYKHQTGWQDLVHPKTGCLSSSTVGIQGPLNLAPSFAITPFPPQRRSTNRWNDYCPSILHWSAASRCR